MAPFLLRLLSQNLVVAQLLTANYDKSSPSISSLFQDAFIRVSPQDTCVIVNSLLILAVKLLLLALWYSKSVEPKKRTTYTKRCSLTIPNTFARHLKAHGERQQRGQ
jgi:hypothetical protein